ncbi:MAG: hypothetical protein J6C81_04725 [Muribaculaceae bacterium]|nr:hypothetical protein [Muribaculaceae bacterium]
MVESMNRCQSSALFQFLSSMWGEDETMRLFRLYNVGATTRMNDAAVFWQVDVNGGIRTGKIMRYGNDGQPHQGRWIGKLHVGAPYEING